VAELLTPVLRTDPRPDPQKDPWDVLYIFSFMRLRRYVGILGLALPAVVPLVDKIAFNGDPAPRGSISAYYYSGSRELFVAILAATGIFMVSYKVAERNLDNLLSVTSGIAAVFIALFPTGRPETNPPPLTPLQNLISADWTKYVHYAATLTFVAALTGLSICFGIREAHRTQQRVGEPDARFSPEFWRNVHFTCAGFMVAAILWIVGTALFGGPKYSTLVGEWTAAWRSGSPGCARASRW
jgi:hypothetical protein